MFKLKSSFKPTGDQPQAIEKLGKGIEAECKNQVLLGVTGSGKTFTIANVIQNLQIPTLIISHNKTLAGQLYQEFRDFFPKNAVSYFVSYYDYYQPEAYIPQSDTYIEKEAQINELIDKLRLQSTTNILTRSDVIVVASVSCIYNIGSPKEYGNFTLEVAVNDKVNWSTIANRLAELQYERSEFDFKRGTFRIRGNHLDIYPAYEDNGYRIVADKERIIRIEKFNPITGEKTQNLKLKTQNHNSKLKTKLIIYPAKHYLMDPQVFEPAEKKIREDLAKEYGYLKKHNKLIEAQRLLQRVNYDLEIIKEIGYVNGIENYSRYFDGRAAGAAPFTLLDYFKEAYKNNFLVVIDESHMTVPQLRGMYNGDFSRKNTLINFGFRLKASLDNRPLKFDEFYKIPSKIIYTSATPDEWELNKIKNKILNIKNYYGLVEQLVRPTGIVDPKIIIKPAKDEVSDLIREIEARKGQKILVTSLTKKIAEDLSNYLKEKKIRAEYLHSDIHTLERSDILDNLRRGNFDILIGVNLLREGLDLPEVSLVVILDADREGFLRSKTALIQTMGRAARNIQGEVIIYADEITKSIKAAIDEINRRRDYQIKYNITHNITPKTIYKPIREKIVSEEEIGKLGNWEIKDIGDRTFDYLEEIKLEALTPYDKKKIIKRLEKEMRKQAEDLNFEMAISIRNKINELKK